MCIGTRGGEADGGFLFVWKLDLVTSTIRASLHVRPQCGTVFPLLHVFFSAHVEKAASILAIES